MRAWWAGLAAVLAGCPYEGRDPVGADGGGDGPRVVDGAADAEGLGPFGAPTPIVLAGAEPGDDDPSLTGDELELYFNATRGATSADIWVATRNSTAESWSLPRMVTELSSIWGETTPEVSTDGLTIYFASERPGGQGNHDIWISTRLSRAAMWTDPVVVPSLGSPAAESSPGTPDGLAIVFTTNAAGTSDIVASSRPDTQSAWTAWVAEDAISSSGHDGSPWLMADHLTLYLDSDRSGQNRLYVVRRETVSALFPTATPVPGLDDPAYNDQDPWVSPDQRHIVFWSNRGGQGGLWEAFR
jgi:Tol biopolymer transport system component